jgi:hypothetical protein
MRSDQEETMTDKAAVEAEGSTFQEIRDAVFSDPYDEYPVHKVTIGTFFKRGENLLLRDCKRSLVDHADMWEPHLKLLHTTGIAFAGTWNVTEETPFTGYFSKGSQGLVIARVSTLLARNTAAPYRGFGLAIKLWPTMDPNERAKTANIVTIDTILGTDTAHFRDTTVYNNPAFGMNSTLPFFFGVMMGVMRGFNGADEDAVYRTVKQVAALGVPEGGTINSPPLFGAKVSADTPTGDGEDFRDELSLKNCTQGKLRIDMEVAAERELADATMLKLGHMEFTESVVSKTSDESLYFRHDRLRGGDERGA